MTPDHVTFRVDCPPMGFPVEVRVYADGAAMIDGRLFHGEPPPSRASDAVLDAWPDIEAECRRIFGEGWRK